MQPADFHRRQLLRVHVKRVLQSENGLASFECRIDDENGQVASANLTVFQPAEDEAVPGARHGVNKSS